MTGEYDGKSFEDKGEILAIEPAKRLCFSHFGGTSGTSGKPDGPENYHVVTITLNSKGAGTEAVFAQSNPEGGVIDADRQHRADYEKNWQTVLKSLGEATEKFVHGEAA
jgi:hypothetical protein